MREVIDRQRVRELHKELSSCRRYILMVERNWPLSSSDMTRSTRWRIEYLEGELSKEQ